MADQLCLIPLIRQLAGSSRKDEKRQDENTGRQRDHDLRAQACVIHGGVGDQNDQRILENIVIECTQKLGNEKG